MTNQFSILDDYPILNADSPEMFVSSLEDRNLLEQAVGHLQQLSENEINSWITREIAETFSRAPVAQKIQAMASIISYYAGFRFSETPGIIAEVNQNMANLLTPDEIANSKALDSLLQE